MQTILRFKEIDGKPIISTNALVSTIRDIETLITEHTADNDSTQKQLIDILKVLGYETQDNIIDINI